ncbi:MAG: glycosyltransferase [Acidobacteria bacterium]|nr:glycosyltransferase [Acidobacteriota bacterium]
MRRETCDVRIALRTLDLRRPLEPIDDVEDYRRVRVIVTDAGSLVGSMDVWNYHRPITPARLSHTLVEWLTYPIIKRAVTRQYLSPAISEGAGGDRRLPPDASVSIVVATCDRASDLRRCLRALLAQVSPRRIEVIVVDNRPSSGVTPSVIAEFPGVVLIKEHRVGLSYARNAGFAAATGDILIATDDDAVAPEGWIEKLVAPFVRPEVMAVTGHVLPMELETEAQCRFEAYGGLGRGFSPFEVDPAWFRRTRGAVPTWNIGATANAAFRAAIFADPRIGLLDESLGAGTPTGCSEDTLLFYRILKAGHTIVYQPDAWVRHSHRSTMDSLRRQIYAYSKGHVAYQLITWLEEEDRRALVRLLYSLPLTYLRRARERLRGRSDYPVSLILLEIAGNLAGPWALWQSRRRVRRLGRSAGYVPVAFREGSEGTAEAVTQALSNRKVEGMLAEDDAVHLESPLPETARR